jgi:hypothetical protein
MAGRGRGSGALGHGLVTKHQHVVRSYRARDGTFLWDAPFDDDTGRGVQIGGLLVQGGRLLVSGATERPDARVARLSSSTTGRAKYHSVDIVSALDHLSLGRPTHSEDS